MSVFSEHNEPMSESLGQKMMERCKRDYESEIARAKERQRATQKLGEAMETYVDVIGAGNRQFTLTSLYGALMLEERSEEKRIAELQRLWEEDK